MNKTEFVDLVKEVGGYETKKDAEKAVSAFVDAVVKALSKKEGSVELIGFGKFETAKQAAKEGTVPGTNKKYKTEEKFVPKFKAGKSLKDTIATASKKWKK
ncbi:MAG: HU family DNA-binding protein [Helicobacter sp.]|nr:HU family DNA-binding protein [Helicobacteraceae bacterium]MDY3113355.1 HU family DNA-binding protein [Helicobacter sp.]